jgi:hypothetical protein
MNLIQILNLDPKIVGAELETLMGQFLLQDVSRPASLDAEHRELLNHFQAVQKSDSELGGRLQLDLLNVVLRSALRCGDFLNLSTLIYKTDKEIERTPEAYPESFLAAYFEVAGLYHFYDNDLKQSVCCLKRALESPAVSNQTMERLFYYYIASLIGAYLPLQADEVIQQYKQRHPVLTFNPLLWVVEAIVATENHRSPDDIMYLIGQMQHHEDQDVDFRRLLRATHQLINYVERREMPKAMVPLFPESWEQILRLDLWVKAKLENKFYYNLITDAWQERKKVF